MQETTETRAKLANAINQLRAQGREAEVNSVVSAYKTKYTNQPVVPVEQPKPSFISSTQPTFKASENGATSIPKNIVKTVANIPSSARNLVRNTIAPVNPFDTQSPINIGANIAKGASDIKSLVKGVKDIGVGGTAKALAGGVGSIFKKGADIYKGVGQKIYNNLEENAVGNNSVSSGVGTSIAQGISNVAKVGIEDPLLIPSLIYAPSNVRGTGFTDDAISKLSGLNKVDTKLSTVLPKAKVVFEPSTKALEQKVITQFEKGVKPLLNARSTPEMVKKYKNNIVNATKVIDDNKMNLSFVDDIGEITVGKNPQTLQQLSEAVDQTKKSVFSEYNALTKQSGEKGLTVKTDNIANELDTVIADEALQISNPTAVQYAKDLKDRLSYRELSPEVTENVIKNYNESLKAFYKNPSYDNASKASIDALIVNKLRQQLDEGITNLTGEQYQALKNKYGALKTIENDVLKATLREARKNNKGLIDFTDIFSGSDIISGIVSMNPAQLARGAGARGVKEYYKYLNSPNRAVKKMFNSTEKLNQRSIPKIDLTNSPNTVSDSLLKTNPSTNIPITPNINDITPSIQPIKNKSIPLKNNQAGFISTGKDNPLYQEARKYKSADEFVKDKINAYHGTFKNFEEFKVGSRGSYGKGIYFENSPSGVSKYGNRTMETMVDIKNPFKLSADNMNEWKKYYSNDKALITKRLKKDGYDGILVGNEIVAFEPSQVKTKSQLEKIWKETNMKTNRGQAGFISTGKDNALYQEARKYKSADEFVKERGGVGENIAKAMQKEFELEKLTDELSKKANSFGGKGGLVTDKTPEYLEIQKQLNSAMKELRTFKTSELGKIIQQERRKLPLQVRMRMLKGDIKTKSQLEQIWKESNMKTNRGMTAINPLTVGAGASAIGAGGMYLNNKDKK